MFGRGQRLRPGKEIVLSESLHSSHSPTPDDRGGGASGSNGNHARNGSSKTGLSRSVSRAESSRALAPLGPPAPVAVSTLPADDDNDTIDLGQYLKALKRRWKLVLSVLLGAVVLGGIRTMLQKPIYESTATILVASSSGVGGVGGNNPLASFPGFQMTSRSLGQQMVVILNPNVQRGAMKSLRPETQRVLRPFVKANMEPVREADAILVKVQSRNAKASAKFANAICNQYVLQSQQQNGDQVRLATKYVRNQLKVVKKQLDEASAALKNYREKNNTVDLSGETSDLIGRVGTLEGQKTGAIADRQGAQAQLRIAQSQLREIAPGSRVPTSIVRTPEVERLRARLSELGVERVTQLREFKPNSRTIQDIDAQIRDVQNQLNAEDQTQEGAWQPNPLRQSLIQEIARLEGQIQAFDARVSGLNGSIAQGRGQLRQLPSRVYDLGQLITDESTERESYVTLSRKYQDLRIQEEQKVANARVSTWAEAATTPISPRKAFNLLMSLVLGSTLGCALALLLDRLDNRVHGDDDVQSTTHLPILAHIPDMEAGAQLLSAGSSAAKTTPLLEAFRMLRVNLAYSGLDEPLRSVVVTSSKPGEGKSTSAINLATVIAMSGRKVVLVDCDLRRPKLHTLFDLPNRAGFTSVVAGAVGLEEALQTTDVPGLRLLTSGPTPPNPPELLDSRGGRRVLQQVIDEADFVVLDCPPALLLSDAQIVATSADAVLLVVGCNQASKREVERTTSILTRSGARILGVLFNKAPLDAAAYGGYRSYFHPEDGASPAALPNGNGHHAPGELEAGKSATGEPETRIDAALPPSRS